MAHGDTKAVSTTNQDIFVEPMGNSPRVSEDVELPDWRKPIDVGVSFDVGASGNDPALGGSIYATVSAKFLSFGRHGYLGVRPGLGFSALSIARSEEYTSSYEEPMSDEDCYPSFGCGSADAGPAYSGESSNDTASWRDTSLRVNMMLYMDIGLGRLGPGEVIFSYGPAMVLEYHKSEFSRDFIDDGIFVLSGGFAYAMDNGFSVNLGVKSDIIDMATSHDFNDRRMILGTAGASYAF